MTMSLLIKNAHIVGAADDYNGDIFIQGESIVAVGKNIFLSSICIFYSIENLNLEKKNDHS